jgi:dihydroorotate dehydrogenase subfamily 1
MIIEKKQIGNKMVMPFTIPSGIFTTEVSCLEKIAKEIPELGILTTKSIGPKPREGNREPILAQYIPQGFVNAVGLTNPGAEDFAKKLSQANFPEDKFLLASIFGKNASEFVYVARTLEEHVDGFELNLSCPHAKGYGMQLGQDKDAVGEITREVVRTTKKPVFAKLTPNAGDIGEIAKSAINAKAYGIVAINTVGPGYHSYDGNSILTNKVGGLSGTGITPIGLKCIREIRQAIGEDIPIIGMGGIKNCSDVEAYAEVGATVFGIGSALAGMTKRETKAYFSALRGDIESTNHTNNAERLLKKVNMQYQKVNVEKRIDPACDFRIIQTDEIINAEPGQFVFAWIPGVGEKPFSVMDDNPLTLGILERGEFTKKLNSLQEGDSFYVRGPYGQGVNVPQKSNVVLVGGGCGIAGLYLLAKRLSKESNVTTLLAAKDKEHITYLEKFKNYGSVKVATEDGSLGRRGLVTDLMNGLKEGSYFFNCGPKQMIDAVLPLELKVSSPQRVYSSVDYMTRCGIGICGSCADKKGRRTCIEGPFINP